MRAKGGSIQKIGERGGFRAWYYLLLPPLSLVASLGAIGYSIVTLHQLCTTKTDGGSVGTLHVVVVVAGLLASFGTVCYAMYQMHSAYRRVSGGLHTQTSEGVLSDHIIEWYQKSGKVGSGKGGAVKRVTSHMVSEFLVAQKKLQMKKAEASAARKQRRQTLFDVSVCM
jgi:hypothetical protein